MKYAHSGMLWYHFVMIKIQMLCCKTLQQSILYV